MPVPNFEEKVKFFFTTREIRMTTLFRRTSWSAAEERMLAAEKPGRVCPLDLQLINDPSQHSS